MAEREARSSGGGGGVTSSRLAAATAASFSSMSSMANLKRHNHQAAMASDQHYRQPQMVANFRVVTQQPAGLVCPTSHQHETQQQQAQPSTAGGVNVSRASAGELSCTADPQNPYPQYVPVTFFHLTQTSRPRNWCLAIVSNKYPVHSIKHTTRPTWFPLGK